MKSYQEVLEFIEEENVQFLRLVFLDVFGQQKNMAITPGELKRAVTQGISINPYAIPGFGRESRADLYLRPDLSTISLVPWRPIDGRVAKMFCNIVHADGTPYEKDSRFILQQAVKAARERGIEVDFGAEIEFYVFKQDENGMPTSEPLDYAGYLDVDPDDHGDNIRRNICFTLQEMNIEPESSHHEQGPGQNEIDFRYSDALTSADNTATFKWVVRSIANGNGAWADFSPKPIQDQPGNGMHLNISLRCRDGEDHTENFMGGILHYILDMTLFLNPTEKSYDRFGAMEAPGFVSWSVEDRSQLIRIPQAGKKRIEVRSVDPTANPYLAHALLIYAGLEGIDHKMNPGEPLNLNLYQADPEVTSQLTRLPANRFEAVCQAKKSKFLKKYLPKSLMEAYFER